MARPPFSTPTLRASHLQPSVLFFISSVLGLAFVTLVDARAFSHMLSVSLSSAGTFQLLS